MSDGRRRRPDPALMLRLDDHCRSDRRSHRDAWLDASARAPMSGSWSGRTPSVRSRAAARSRSATAPCCQIVLSAPGCSFSAMAFISKRSLARASRRPLATRLRCRLPPWRSRSLAPAGPTIGAVRGLEASTGWPRLHQLARASPSTSITRPVTGSVDAHELLLVELDLARGLEDGGPGRGIGGLGTRRDGG